MLQTCISAGQDASRIIFTSEGEVEDIRSFIYARLLISDDIRLHHDADQWVW